MRRAVFLIGLGTTASAIGCVIGDVGVLTMSNTGGGGSATHASSSGSSSSSSSSTGGAVSSSSESASSSGKPCTGTACEPSLTLLATWSCPGADAGSSTSPGCSGFGIAVDATNVYWSTAAKISSVPIKGGSTKPLASTTEGWGVAVVPGFVVFSDRDNGTNNLGSVSSLPLPSGLPSPLLNDTGPQGVVARANLVAWVDSSSTLVVCTSWAEGECASTLSSVSGFIDPFAVALDANNTFYVTDIEAGAVWKVPYAGSLLGSMQSLSTAEEGAKGIAVDASSTFLYWAASTSGVVAKYPIDPDAGTPMALATGLTQPNFVAVDETDVYFTTTSGANGGAVQRCPLPSCEGGPFMVASGRNDPEAIAVDATAVYWVESGQLFKVLK